MTMIRESKLQHFEKVSEGATGGPRKAWHELGNLVGIGKRGVVGAIHTDAGTVVDKQRIADEFCKFFSTVIGVANNEDDDGISLANETSPVSNGEFRFHRIEEEDVLNLLKRVDTNKASGVDRIGAGVLQMAAEGISHSLTTLLNASLDTGQVPSKWKLAVIIPVTKSGTSESLENFRPISLLPVVAKVFERLVHQQLFSHLQKYNILHPTQSGFRPRYTTQDVLVGLVDSWRQALDAELLVGAIMMDLSKAFDCVDHSILVRKLRVYGVNGGELRWFQDYLHGRKQRVRISSAYSTWSDIRRGIPQGSILGPLLFNLYVQDLPEAVRECKSMQYADDTTLSLVRKNAKDLEHGLTEGAEKVAEWVRKNKLTLNVKKTQLLLLGRKRREANLNQVEVRMGEQVLPRSSSARCLGMWIVDKLTWKDHISRVHQKCFGALTKLRRNREVLPTALKKVFSGSCIATCRLLCSCLARMYKGTARKGGKDPQLWHETDLIPATQDTQQEMRRTLHWMPLERRRVMFRLILMHRCMNQLAPAYLTESVHRNCSLGYIRTRGSNNPHFFPV